MLCCTAPTWTVGGEGTHQISCGSCKGAGYNEPHQAVAMGFQELLMALCQDCVLQHFLIRHLIKATLHMRQHILCPDAPGRCRGDRHCPLLHLPSALRNASQTIQLLCLQLHLKGRGPHADTLLRGPHAHAAARSPSCCGQRPTAREDASISQPTFLSARPRHAPCWCVLGHSWFPEYLAVGYAVLSNAWPHLLAHG